MTAELRIGIVGYGMMGRAHCYGYRVAPMLRSLPVTPVVTVLSGRDGAAAAKAAASYGVPETVTDWRTLIDRDDVDVVDICTPPGTHAEIAIAAAHAGKAVLCEKPLAVSYPQAKSALAAVRAAGVHHAVGFNYRKLPAVALMRKMIDDGAVGQVRLWRATWLSDEFTDPGIPFDWRFDRAMGGTTIADLGSHLIDLALWMVGDISEVCAQSETFIKERSLYDQGVAEVGVADVTVDDASSALIKFAAGARGTVEMARSAVRRPCDFTVEVNGSTGTLVFDYARLNELWYGSAYDDPGRYGLTRSGPSIIITLMRPSGGRSARGSATAPALPTRSPTCSRAGRRHRGRRASSKEPRSRRSAMRWSSRLLPVAGFRSATSRDQPEARRSKDNRVAP